MFHAEDRLEPDQKGEPTLPTAPINILTITVTFNPNAITNGGELFIFSGDMPADKNLIIPPGLSLISFTLGTIPGFPATATFPTYPLQWFNSTGDPVPAPDWFTYHWLSERQFTLVDFNSATERMTHPFNIVVAYQGNTYGSDPVIVNQPPDT
jgi:hypothetical protein